MAEKKKSLGKGLSALINNDDLINSPGYVPNAEIEQIDYNKDQPRKFIDPDELVELADSIRSHGIIEPLIVTKKNDNSKSKYKLVAGERRLRAAQIAQLQTVPVIIKEISPQEIIEIALIENIQRKDLSPIEEAIAYEELHEKFQLKLEEISKRVGKNISTISNKIRLLKLPENIQQGLMSGEISESHAYQILSLKSKDAQLAVYNLVIKQGLSVAKTEEMVRKITLANKQSIEKTKRQNSVIYDEFTAKINEDLQERLGSGFKLVKKKKGGKITIPFTSDDELEKLYEFIKELNS